MIAAIDWESLRTVDGCALIACLFLVLGLSFVADYASKKLRGPRVR